MSFLDTRDRYLWNVLSYVLAHNSESCFFWLQQEYEFRLRDVVRQASYLSLGPGGNDLAKCKSQQCIAIYLEEKMK